MNSSDAEVEDPVLTSYEKDVVIGIRLTMAALSFFGSLFIIISIVRIKKLATTSSKLIFFLTVSNLGDAVFIWLTPIVYKREDALYGP